MSAIIDTATDFTAVEGADCSVCNGETYDISTNVDRGQASIESKTIQENYGRSKFKGRKALDQVCFQLGKCVEQQFLYVSEHGALDADVDAIIGFARPGATSWAWE